MDGPATYSKSYRIVLSSPNGGNAQTNSASNNNRYSSFSSTQSSLNFHSNNDNSKFPSPISSSGVRTPSGSFSAPRTTPPSRKDSREPMPFPLPAIPRISDQVSDIDDDEDDDDEVGGRVGGGTTPLTSPLATTTTTNAGSSSRNKRPNPTSSSSSFFLSPTTTDNLSVLSSADSALDMHAEIAQAVTRAVAIHNASWQSTLAASEEAWEKDKEDAVHRATTRAEETLARERAMWENERRELTLVKESQLKKAAEEVARARAERDEEASKTNGMSEALEKLRAETVPVSSHRAALLGLEIQLKAREKSTEDAVRAMKATQGAAVGRAAVLVRMSEDRLMLAVATREAELKDTVAKLEAEYKAEIDKVTAQSSASLIALETRLKAEHSRELDAEREAHAVTKSSLSKVRGKALVLKALTSSRGSPPNAAASAAGTPPQNRATPVSGTDVDTLDTSDSLSGFFTPNAVDVSSSKASPRSRAAIRSIWSAMGPKLARAGAASTITAGDGILINNNSNVSSSNNTLLPSSASSASSAPAVVSTAVTGSSSSSSSSASGSSAAVAGGLNSPTSLSSSPTFNEGNQPNAASTTTSTTNLQDTNDDEDRGSSKPMEYISSASGLVEDEHQQESQQQEIHSDDHDEHEFDELHSKIDDLVAQLASATQKIAELEEEVASYHDQLEILEIDKGDVEDSLKHEQATLRTVNEDLTSTRAELEAASTENSHLKSKIEGLQEDLNRATTELQVATAELVALRPAIARGEIDHEQAVSLRQQLALALLAVAADASSNRIPLNIASDETSSVVQEVVKTIDSNELIATAAAKDLETNLAVLGISHHGIMPMISKGETGDADTTTSNSSSSNNNTSSIANSSPSILSYVQPRAPSFVEVLAALRSLHALGDEIHVPAAAALPSLSSSESAETQTVINTLQQLAEAEDNNFSDDDDDEDNEETTSNKNAASSSAETTKTLKDASEGLTSALAFVRDMLRAAEAAVEATAAISAPEIDENQEKEASLKILETTVTTPSSSFSSTLTHSTTVPSSSLPPHVDFDPLFVNLTTRRYSGLLSLLQSAGSSNDDVASAPAARGILSFLSILAETAGAPRTAVDILQSSLDAYSKRQLLTPTTTHSSASSSSVSTPSSSSSIDAALTDELMKTADSLRDAAISAERRYGAALADAALVREATATALLQARSYVTSRDAQLRVAHDGLVQAGSKAHSLSMLVVDAQEKLALVKDTITSLHTARRHDRETFDSLRNEWASASDGYRTALHKLEAELESLATFETARAPFLARAASVLGNSVVAPTKQAAAAITAAPPANPLASLMGARTILSAAHRLAGKAKAAVAQKRAEAEAAAAEAAAAQKRADEAEASAKAEAEALAKIASEKALAAAAAADAAAAALEAQQQKQREKEEEEEKKKKEQQQQALLPPPPPLPMSPLPGGGNNNYGLFSPTNAGYSNNNTSGMNNATPMPPTPGGVYGSSRGGYYSPSSAANSSSPPFMLDANTMRMMMQMMAQMGMLNPNVSNMINKNAATTSTASVDDMESNIEASAAAIRMRGELLAAVDGNNTGSYSSRNNNVHPTLDPYQQQMLLMMMGSSSGGSSTSSSAGTPAVVSLTTTPGGAALAAFVGSHHDIPHSSGLLSPRSAFLPQKMHPLKLSSPPPVSMLGMTSPQGSSSSRNVAPPPNRAPPAIPTTPSNVDASTTPRNKFAAAIGTSIPYSAFGDSMSAQLAAAARSSR